MTDDPRTGAALDVTVLPRTRPSPAVRVEGELDLSTADLLVPRVVAAVDGSGRIDLDLGGLGFLDVRGAHALVDLAAACRARGTELVITGIPRQARRVLEIVDAEGRTGPWPAADEAAPDEGQSSSHHGLA